MHADLHTFHIGHIFVKTPHSVKTPHQESTNSSNDYQSSISAADGASLEANGASHQEQNLLTMLITAKHSTDLKHDPLLLLKQHLTTALHDIGFTESFTSVVQCPPYAHPGRYATISVLGTVIGELFEVHPNVRERFKLPARAAVATVNLTALLAMESAPLIAHELPRFPSIRYDETIQRTHDDELRDSLRQLSEKNPLLESVEIVDLYDGRPLQSGQFNLTLRFTYRAADKTLTEDEA